MTTCEICGRPRGYERGQCACGLSFATSASVEECYRLGYERLRQILHPGSKYVSNGEAGDGDEVCVVCKSSLGYDDHTLADCVQIIERDLTSAFRQVEGHYVAEAARVAADVEREKARADAAEDRARARELDMHEAQGLAWRLRREIRAFDSAQMTAIFGGAWREVETAASLIRDEWDPWDFGDEPTAEGAANLLVSLALDGEPDADEIADARAPDGAAERLRERADEYVREARRNAKEPTP